MRPGDGCGSAAAGADDARGEVAVVHAGVRRAAEEINLARRCVADVQDERLGSGRGRKLGTRARRSVSASGHPANDAAQRRSGDSGRTGAG